MPQLAVDGGRLEWLAHRYLDAKAAVIAAGYAEEIDRPGLLGITSATESVVLEEAAWVVFNSGMRERVVRQHFPAIREAFLGLTSAAAICRDESGCRSRALKAFNHAGKVNAVIAFAGHVAAVGTESFVDGILSVGPSYLCALPYFGPATSRHLAKNLGLEIAKPDRHLERLAKQTGYAGAQALCEAIAAATAERVSVVDTVLWRFSAIFPSRLVIFSD